MASFPGAKVHRTSRRKLGRGQHVQPPAAVASLVGADDVVTITFNVPVVVNGLIPLSIAGISGVPVQAVVDAQTVTQTYGESVAGNAWVLPGGGQSVFTFQGGTLAPASGTF